MKNFHFGHKLFLLLLALPFIVLMSGLWAVAANVPIGDDYDAVLNYLNYPRPERLFHLADFQMSIASFPRVL